MKRKIQNAPHLEARSDTHPCENTPAFLPGNDSLEVQDSLAETGALAVGKSPLPLGLTAIISKPRGDVKKIPPGVVKKITASLLLYVEIIGIIVVTCVKNVREKRKEQDL